MYGIIYFFTNPFVFVTLNQYLDDMVILYLSQFVTRGYHSAVDSLSKAR
jgi:hypothetical protein